MLIKNLNGNIINNIYHFCDINFVICIVPIIQKNISINNINYSVLNFINFTEKNKRYLLIDIFDNDIIKLNIFLKKTHYNFNKVLEEKRNLITINNLLFFLIVIKNFILSTAGNKENFKKIIQCYNSYLNYYKSDIKLYNYAGINNHNKDEYDINEITEYLNKYINEHKLQDIEQNINHKRQELQNVNYFDRTNLEIKIKKKFVNKKDVNIKNVNKKDVNKKDVNIKNIFPKKKENIIFINKLYNTVTFFSIYPLYLMLLFLNYFKINKKLKISLINKYYKIVFHSSISVIDYSFKKSKQINNNLFEIL